MLQDDAIAVRIFEGRSETIPIRIERPDRFETGSSHSVDRRDPLVTIRQVEHEQVVGRGRLSRHVAVRARELEVVGRALLAQHQAVEAVVTLEAEEDAHSQALFVERQ